MLTADLVRTRRVGSELTVVRLSTSQRVRALELGAELIALAEAGLGATRAEIEESWATVPVKASEQKLFVGLQKLVEDRMEFSVAEGAEPRGLRSDVFLAAARERSAAEVSAWDRDAFVARAALARGLAPEALIEALFADLRSAQLLRSFSSLSAQHLVDHYELAQQQAVFLRAVDVVADVRCHDAYAYRTLFRKLKFLRLLHRIEPRDDGGHRITIDGPFSLFGPSTKYGLELALAVPMLIACDEYVLRATLRWGKDRTPLTYKLAGKKAASCTEQPPLPDEVAAFLVRFAALASPWSCEASTDILDVPGFGLCVPDVRFVQRDTGEVAYLEVLGYWSRAAVWNRVELCTAGLHERVIFAVSSKLRVSEDVLPAELPSELYVYKGMLLPREVLRRLSGGELPA